MLRETVGRPMEVLLVEDSVPAARLAIGGLKRGRFEHRLTWLRDGEQASQFLRREGVYRQAPQPDLVLLDLGLPGKDGREVLTEIRSDERLRSMPVVVMTASPDQQDVLVSENLSVEAYLVKPVDIEKFFELITELKGFWKADMIVPTTQDNESATGALPEHRWV